MFSWMHLFTTNNVSIKAFKLPRRRIRFGSTSDTLTIHTIKDEWPSSISLPNNDYFIYLHDLYNELYFIVDSASPVSFLPASIYQNQTKDHTYSAFLLATDGHPLRTYGSIDLLLHFEDVPHHHVNHSFTVTNVQSPIIGLDLLSKLHAVVDVHNKSISCNHTQTPSPDLSSLPLINYQNLSCNDILNLFPDATSGEFFQGKCRLPVERTVSVKGLPFSHAARKLGPQKYKELNSHIDKMLNQGIIEYSRSSFRSPVHLVPKKGPGAFRFCVNYRTLNAQTENQCFTLPRISDVTHRLHGSHVFSALDLKNAYWLSRIRKFAL